jgi:hypothetical protein
LCAFKIARGVGGSGEFWDEERLSQSQNRCYAASADTGPVEWGDVVRADDRGSEQVYLTANWILTTIFYFGRNFKHWSMLFSMPLPLPLVPPQASIQSMDGEAGDGGSASVSTLQLIGRSKNHNKF